MTGKAREVGDGYRPGPARRSTSTIATIRTNNAAAATPTPVVTLR